MRKWISNIRKQYRESTEGCSNSIVRKNNDKFGNKRSKGPHNVHLSTMCHLLWWIGQGGNFYFFYFIGPKNTNLVEDVKILFPVKFRWILFSGFREKVKIQPRPVDSLIFVIYSLTIRTLFESFAFEPSTAIAFKSLKSQSCRTFERFKIADEG